MKKIIILLSVLFCFSAVDVSEAFMKVRYGETLHIVNITPYNLQIVYYKSWSGKKTKRLSPGGDIIIDGLREGDHVIARAYENGVVGVETIRVRKQRSGTQLWRINRIRKLR